MTRHIDFDGIDNFRDFGGYDTAYGRQLKRGLLYRSANHAYATEADLARMRDMGLAVIVDLRRSDERAREPAKRWPGFAAAVVENDILSDHADWVTLMKDLPAITPQWFYDDGKSYYARAPFEARHVDLFRRYFETLAGLDGPLVVHCAAGKDRTGFICALTHHIAGVSHDDMVADYLLTNDEDRLARKMDFLGPWIETQTGLKAPREALRVAVSVNTDYLETAFAAVIARHGSIDGYLAEALGVDEALREKIRERLLD